MSAQLDLPAFGEIEPTRVLVHDDLFAVVTDKYPVSPGHCLIIARRPVARFQALTSVEKTRLLHWIDWTQQHLSTALTPAPGAFNFGLNDGSAAGQTMPQFHFHIIPRYAGDVPDPRGGVRYVVPSKARYWDAAPPVGSELVTRVDSRTQLSSPRSWIGNDASQRNHHSAVSLETDPFDLILHWKASAVATPQLVGYFRLHLTALLAAGYIRMERSGRVRVRFYHDRNGEIVLEPKAGGPRLLVGKYKELKSPAPRRLQSEG